MTMIVCCRFVVVVDFFNFKYVQVPVQVLVLVFLS